MAGFRRAVAKQHKVKVWLAGRREMAFVAGLYPAVGRYINWPDHMRAESIMTGKPMGGFYYFAHFPRWELVRAIGYKDFHFLDAYRVRLHLKAEAELSPARLPVPDEIARAREFLTRHGCAPGRTVILNIDARSTAVGGIDPRYWPILAAAIRTQGLHPFVNQGPTTQLADGLREERRFLLADYRGHRHRCRRRSAPFGLESPTSSATFTCPRSLSIRMSITGPGRSSAGPRSRNSAWPSRRARDPRPHRQGSGRCAPHFATPRIRACAGRLISSRRANLAISARQMFPPTPALPASP